MTLNQTEPDLNLPLSVTIGEPSGIGPEVILKAWYKRGENNLNPFFVIGDVQVLNYYSNLLRLNVPIKEISNASETELTFNNYLPVLAIDCQNNFNPGSPNPSTASMVIGAIDKAVELIHAGEARAMVTAPLQKSVLYDAGFNCPGHTEYLAQLCQKYWNEIYHPVMMLASPELCVVPLTIHVALKDVPGLISEDLIIKTVKIINLSMKKHFNLIEPKIAVCGLNPHAGENNAMGREDSEIIAPAIQKLRKEAIRVTGPHPPDTMFHKVARNKYDVALCMYHDQALIPIKTIDFDAGVNVTMGLPIVRTSPDHGTALDIAGKGLANPTSMINAIKLAHRMTMSNV
jgi:4-hydroxythreonine-4-phosphate dehydrogenase